MNKRPSDSSFPAFPAMPIDMARPAAEQIAAALKSAILNIALAPGSQISENEVGQMFGASRTPVREAFAQLRDEGLLITYPSRGTYISKLSERKIRGAQFLREALEVAVVERLCAEGIAPNDLAALQANIAAQTQAIASDDKAAFQALDDSFHTRLAAATGYERIGTLLVREKSALDRLRVLSLHDSKHMETLLSEHSDIVHALRYGYTGMAMDRMRRHLRGILKTLSVLIEANQNYFEPEKA
ncbi:MAG: GntR family transcriptional regulator [Paracoccaceae bacterium]